MKLISVIVDGFPKSCEDCIFYDDYIDPRCMIPNTAIDDALIDDHYSGRELYKLARHPACPLQLQAKCEKSTDEEE